MRFGGGNFDDAPVTQHVLVNFGANPVHGKRYQAYVERGVESLDGLHKADIAFLNQVSKRQAIAGIALRDVDHETQVRHNQFACGLEIFFIAKAVRQCLLSFFAQNRNATNGLDVRVQAAYRAFQCQVMIECCDCRCHEFCVPPL